jgi:hypothetical protein
MKRLLAVAAALAVACTSAFADSSYFLIQGPFGPAGETTTSKWRIDYESGDLVTGRDLLGAVFGEMTNSGTTKYGAKLYSAGNATKGITFLEYSWGLLIHSISLGGIEIFAGPDLGDPYWGYFVAGGSGEFQPAGYGSDAWHEALEGFSTRYLADGSFDGWLMGYWGDTLDSVPLETYFADATVIAIPEPGGIGLAFIGFSGIWVLKRRQRPTRA